MSFENILNTDSEDLINKVIENEETGNNTENINGIEKDFIDDVEPLNEEETGTPEPTQTETATISEPYSHLNEENEVDGLSDQDKKRNFLYCQLYVMMLGEAGEILAKLIAGEWGEEIGNKYTVSKTKQNDIARAWAEILNIEMKTKSPKGALAMLIIANFVPLLFTALKVRFSKVKKKKEQAKQKKHEPKIVFVNDTPFVEEKTVQPTKAEILQHDFKKIDDKGTAEIREDKIEEIKTELKPTKKKRGRKIGSMKNPETNKFETPIKTETKNGENFYWVYSWGLKKSIPKKYR